MGAVPVVAAYLRVSSKGQGFESQRAAVEQAAAARGERIDRWHEEKLSGGTMQRAELAAVLAAARRGELSALYVFRLDRLTRSGIRDTFNVVDELRRHGCRLVTVADGFDFSGPAGDVVLAMFAWCAQLEREAVGARIRAARVRVEAKGGAWGRPGAPPLVVTRVLELRAEGRSVRAIAVALKIPRATVHRMIKRARLEISPPLETQQTPGLAT